MDLSYYQKINGTFGVNTKKQYRINKMAIEYNKAIDNTITNFEVMINTHKAVEVIVDNLRYEKVIIKQSKNEDNPFKEERIINFYPKSDIKRGSIINFNKEEYLIISDIDKDKKVYYKGSMQKTTQHIKFMSRIEQGKICEYPAIIDNQNKYTLGVLEKKDFTIADGRYSITFPANKETLKIKDDDRFILNNSAWKVTNVDITTQKGLVVIMLGEDRKYTSDDDIENEIADRWKYKKNEEKEPEQSKDCNYEIAQNMGFNIHRWNINTFELVKKSKGTDTPCNYEYKIDYKGLSHDCISVKEVDNKLKIRNLKCEYGEIITITFIDKETKKEISQDIKLIK